MTIRVHRWGSRRAQRAIERLARRGTVAVDRRLENSARRIVDRVRRDGDRGLLDAVSRYDGVKVSSVEQLRRALPRESAIGVPAGFEAALERAISAVERFHRPQVREGYRIEEAGVLLEERVLPLRRVGIYVPGGRFPYPSSAVMSVIPARLAGVEEIVVVCPPQALDSSLPLRHTLRRLDVDEVWGMGGAQAVAALAYGTETIAAVDLIAGPGNAWVAAAKRLVSGQVAVDREAGPSEVVIVAASDAAPDLVAADLLAQAEHDPKALAVLITPDRKLAKRVVAELGAQLQQLGRPQAARQSLRALSCGLLVSDLEQALEVAERIAPEHLQLMGEGAEELAPRVRCAGAIFVGTTTPTVVGDYVAGPSHVLPTGGTARFASGLGVSDFVRTTHLVRLDATASAELCRAAAVLAGVEGLVAHRSSAERRYQGEGESD